MFSPSLYTSLVLCLLSFSMLPYGIWKILLWVHLAVAETTHTIKIGNDGMNIDPDNVEADIGDTVNFEFYPNNHSIAQSSYEEPCQPLFGGTGNNPIFSGFFPVNTKEGEKEAKTMFSMKINNTDPIWLYCSQGSHCQDGQVMVINQK